MSSTSPPEESMKALMDAVAQVTSSPALHYAYTQPTASTFSFPGAAGSIAPHHINLGIQSAAVPIYMPGMLIGQGGPIRKRNHDSVLASEAVAVAKRARTSSATHEPEGKRVKRLEQNRLAAIESRRRKKHMVEELQRSIQFYSKANTTLKGQNADLQCQLLVAKQKILVSDSTKPKSKKTGDGSASTVAVSLENTSEKKIAAPEQEAEASKQPSIGHCDSSAYPAIFGNTSNPEMEIQAQQAQFAATQALYKTMGYPAGAARVAASTFYQFVGQTGIVPGASGSNDKAAPPTTEVSMAADAIPQVNPPPMVIADKPAPKKDPEEDTSYIEALNRFAMQQAAAANAAAAAATAAIQAAHLHNQLKKNGSPPSSQAQPQPQAVPSLPFSFPAGMVWPFQN